MNVTPARIDSRRGHVHVRRVDSATLPGLKDSVATVASSVQNAQLIIVSVLEKEEIVAHELHLVNRFFNVHGLHGEPLGADNWSFVRDFGGLRCRMAEAEIGRQRQLGGLFPDWKRR